MAVLAAVFTVATVITTSGPSEPPKFSVKTVVADGNFVTVVGDMAMHEQGGLVPYAYCEV